MSRPRLSDLEPGQEIAAGSVAIDRARLVAYAAASGDQNPIHQDEDFAQSVGLPDVIAHGMWTMGAAVEVLSDWLDDPAAIVAYSARFTNPVVVPAGSGAEVAVAAHVKKVDRETGQVSLELSVTSDGAKVLGRAIAIVALR